MPRVLNKYRDDIPADAVYVGRPSTWGNPYTHVSSAVPGTIRVDTREEAIQAYEDNFPDELRNRLDEIQGKDLVCWCSPQPCHADFLLREANR